MTAAAEQFRQGRSQAAEKLHDVFWKRVLGLARQKLRQRAVSPRQAGASDVAQDALASFFRALGAGRYEFLTGRDGVWALLARITVNKVTDVQRRRPKITVLDEPALAEASQGAALKLSELAVEARPSPADEAEYAEACLAACESVLSRLNDRQRQIVLGKAAGKTNAQLAKDLGCTVRTIELNLAAVRREARQLDMGKEHGQ